MDLKLKTHIADPEEIGKEKGLYLSLAPAMFNTRLSSTNR
jgi:hypothetical protein